MGGLNVRTIKLLLTIITSRLLNYNLQHILSIGKFLKVCYTKSAYANVLMAEKKNSGKVKDKRIGKPACLSKTSETERMWVRAKCSCLRYSPFLWRNSKVVKCILKLESLYSRLSLSLCIDLYYFLLFHN
jgi:hypothetical protein